METLKDFAKEVNKCSKCGLCQSVCPLYKLTGNDCAVSRGKFVVLDGVIKGDLVLNKTINKYLEMCFKCGKCSDFCPAGIDVCRIFRTAKHEYLKNTVEGKFIRILESEKIFDNLMNFAGNFTRVESPKHKPDAKKTILYYSGCADKVDSSCVKALFQIIERLPYNLITGDFKCCGMPFASSGNLERYEEVKKYNTRIINESDCDAVITTCASCKGSLDDYENLNKKVLNFIEFLYSENIRFKFPRKVRVTFHKPCHLKDYLAIKGLFERCENVEYVEMKDYDECCGFSGQFALTNRKLSKELSKNKIKNALATNSDIILTACPACLIGLKQGYVLTKGLFGKYPEIMDITKFLSQAEVYSD